jgi:hypothetical protein
MGVEKLSARYVRLTCIPTQTVVVIVDAIVAVVATI